MTDDNKFDRRTFLKGAGALAGAAGLGVIGFPSIVRAKSQETIRIGMPTILSGRVAQLGISSRNAVKMAVDEFNASGGLNGRKIEMVVRDTKGTAGNASHMARKLINSDGCDMLLDATASNGAFAVQEVIRNNGALCMHTCSETSGLTADPKVRLPNSFRSARQGVHDEIGGGKFAATIAKQKSFKNWITVAPDYEYGQSTTAQFLHFAKVFNPSMHVLSQSWPKLFKSDYTRAITGILQAKPDAVFTCLWGGDLAAFVQQAELYGLFKQFPVFAVNLADSTTLRAMKKVPSGVYSGNRYVPTFPDTKANRSWSEAYHKRYNEYPTNWSWENAVGINFLITAMRQTGNTDGKALAEVMRGMTVKSPFGVDGKITMRKEDQTIIDYATGWGVTQSKPPYVPHITATDWDVILKYEQNWKEDKGYKF